MLLKGVACETSCWVAMSGDFFVEFRSVMCGVWTPVLGELLTVHLYLISATKNTHVPYGRKFSRDPIFAEGPSSKVS